MRRTPGENSVPFTSSSPDLLSDGAEFGKQPLEPMIFRYLFGALLKRGRSRKRFRNTILFDFAQYPKLLVASRARLGAMTSCLTAFSERDRNRPGTKVADEDNLLEKIGSSDF